MLWAPDIPVVEFEGGSVTVVAGGAWRRQAASPPPNSWAARDDAEVAIWLLRLDAGVSWTMPATRYPDVARTMYFFEGDSLFVGDHQLGCLDRRRRAQRYRHRGARRRDRGRVPGSAGPADRRAGRSVRAVRDEHPRRDRAGLRRLPADGFRWLAVGGRRTGARGTALASPVIRVGWSSIRSDRAGRQPHVRQRSDAGCHTSSARGVGNAVGAGHLLRHRSEARHAGGSRARA